MEHDIKITGSQFGKMIGKHAEDFGLDPFNANDRKKMVEIIHDIVYNAVTRFYDEWKGQEYSVLFHVKGHDVVLENKYQEFITIMRNWRGAE